MKDNQRIHTSVPYGNHPTVPADKFARDAQVWSDEYAARRPVGLEHELESDTYDWKHQAPIVPLPELHFDARNSQVIEWTWLGIGLQLAVIPALLIVTTFLRVIQLVGWGIWPMAIVVAVLITLGLVNSLRGLVMFPRADRPTLALLLSLIGVGLAILSIWYFTPRFLSAPADALTRSLWVWR